MELCMNIATPEVPECRNLAGYQDMNFERALSDLNGMGYKALELVTADPEKLDISSVKSLAVKYGFSVRAINSGFCTGRLKLSLSSSEKDRRMFSLEKSKRFVDVASEFGATVNVGILRGSYIEGFPKEETDKLFDDSMANLCDYAERYGVRLSLETICFLQNNFINTMDEGFEHIKRIGRSNLGFTCDTFQLNIEEPSVLDSLEKYKDYCFHVHIADSNRKYPGAGSIDFKSIVNVLRKNGYQGCLSIEARPEPDFHTVAEKSADTILKLI